MAIAQQCGLFFILRANELSSLEPGWLCYGELRQFFLMEPIVYSCVVVWVEVIRRLDHQVWAVAEFFNEFARHEKEKLSAITPTCFASS
jgi:hypothetical protein